MQTVHIIFAAFSVRHTPRVRFGQARRQACMHVFTIYCPPFLVESESGNVIEYC